MGVVSEELRGACCAVQVAAQALDHLDDPCEFVFDECSCGWLHVSVFLPGGEEHPSSSLLDDLLNPLLFEAVFMRENVQFDLVIYDPSWREGFAAARCGWQCQGESVDAS